MTGILGLDMSTKSTGVALPTGRTLTLRAPTTDVARRLHWFEGALVRIARLYQPDLVMVEGYSLGSPGVLSTIRLAELGGVVRCRLHELGIRYLEVPPGQLKRYATANGNAPKERMVMAAVVAGATPRNDDEADAYLLRALGMHGVDSVDLLAADVDHRTIRLEVIAAIDWSCPR